MTVIGSDATLGIRDLTTGARTSRTVRLSSIDVSSAEWIVEAPSECLSNGNCRTLPLANFGKVSFTSATASIGASTSTLPSGSWGTTALDLESTTAIAAEDGTALALATPSSAARADGSFSVLYSERTGLRADPGRPDASRLQRRSARLRYPAAQ